MLPNMRKRARDRRLERALSGVGAKQSGQSASDAIRRAVGHRTSTSNLEKSAARLATRSDQIGRAESDR